MHDPALLIACIALVAFAYAMVGHGGASGYLAVLSLFGFTAAVTRPSALVLNLFVSGIATLQYARGGHFRWRSLWPFALTSVPMTFVGYGIHLDPLVYKRFLAVCLLIAVARMIGLFGAGRTQQHEVPIAPAMAIGAVLGLLSGMLGIGGGILLSPLMLLCGWGDTKQVAAISAPFILVNSASGLLRGSQEGLALPPAAWSWIAVAIAAGLLGSWIGAHKAPEPRLRQALGVVLLFAAVKLWWP